MKIQKSIIFFVALCSLIGCKKNDHDLVGKFYLPNENPFNRSSWIILEFVDDHTFKVTDLYRDSVPGNWRVNGDSLILELNNNTEKAIHYSYQIKNDNMYLATYNQERNEKIDFHYIRANHKFEYLEKKIGVDISLPITTDSLVDLRNNRINYFVFCNKPLNDTLEIKTLKNNDIKSIRNSFESHVKSKRPELYHNMRLVFIADKEITDHELRTIADSINGMFDFHAYRVYKNDTINFRDLYFFGKQI